jgi:hypothetical protein
MSIFDKEMLKMKFILMFVSLFSYAENNNFLYESYQAEYGDDFSRIEKQCRQFFAAEPKEVFKSIEAVYTVLSANNCDFVEVLPLFGSEEESASFKEELLRVYPDFHKSLLVQEERCVMLAILMNYPHEKLLEKYPDLYINFSEFPERLKELTENKALRKMRLTQNKDGSWGNKEKIYCTSLGLLSCLAMGETTTSRAYGPMVLKALKLILKSKPAKNDINIYMWALAESYAMTGIPEIEQKIIKTQPLFEENMILVREHESDPHRFFLQTSVLKSLYSAGIDNEETVKFYANQLKSLPVEPIESAVLLAAFQSFSLDCEVATDFLKKALEELKSEETSMWDDYINISVCFKNGGQPWKLARKVWDKKQKALLKQQASYEVERKFDFQEEQFLNKIFPSFLGFSCYQKRRWLPSAKPGRNSIEGQSYNEIPHEPRDDEFSLDLIE